VLKEKGATMKTVAPFSIFSVCAMPNFPAFLNHCFYQFLKQLKYYKDAIVCNY
jgi:hypothetical protein